LSPLAPKLAEVTAGKLLLKELRRLAQAREDFAFESTLSGLAYANRIKEWKAAVTASRSFSFVCRPLRWRYAGLPRE
jgi:predicted ABC-type ATPase